MIDGQSLNLTHERIAALKALMPDVFSEDRIDIDRLRQTLGDEVFVKNEHYELSWAGKSDARREIQRQTTATLTPDRPASVDFDASDNVFIEGENLEVLRVLQRAYFGQVKMIYIDPPYNTGNDSFIYPDDYAERLSEYRQRTGKADDDGYLNKQDLWHQNRRESGRFHSAWMSMMYPRLFMARNLLSEDGIVFVSIDDNEVSNLRIMLDEIFGEENLLAQFVWKTEGNFDNQAKVKVLHEYVIAYCRNIERFPHPPTIDPAVESDSKLFREVIQNTLVKNGPKNPCSSVELPIGFPVAFKEGIIKARNSAYPHYDVDAIVENHALKNKVNVSSGWSSKDMFCRFIEGGLKPIVDKKDQETSFIISKTGAIEIVKKRTFKSHVISVFTKAGNTQSTSSQLVKEGIFFDYPKPVELVKYLLTMIQGQDFVALDFFAGSATTAQALMELNAEDGGNRSFVLVQLPEPTDPKSEAYRAGYKTIADVSRERIRRVIQKMQREADETAHAIAILDTTIIDKVAQIAEIRATTPIELFDATNPPKAIQRLTVELDKLEKKRSEIRDSHDRLAQTAKNFRAYRLSPSNFNVWQNNTTDPRDIEQLLIDFAQSDKPGAEAERMLTEFLLKTGYPLTTSVEVLDLGGVPAYSVAGGDLLVLLDGYNEAINAQIWATHPKHVVCLDRLFAGRDEVLANLNLELADRNIKLTVI